ncbi:MAG: hypothetical protein KDA66_12170, partial [Planctomycetaceae bacterium]|nr:hypothetical protein [Planctomycetaceae bacterium]
MTHPAFTATRSPNNTFRSASGRSLLFLLALGGLLPLLSGCHLSNGWFMSSSGRAYYQRGNYAAARHEYERALMDQPFNANFAYNAARSMEK